MYYTHTYSEPKGTTYPTDQKGNAQSQTGIFLQPLICRVGSQLHWGSLTLEIKNVFKIWRFFSNSFFKTFFCCLFFVSINTILRCDHSILMNPDCSNLLLWGAWTARCSHLDVVGDECLPQLKHLQHGGCRVVGDGVTLQHVLGHYHLPGQPALVECCV